MKFKKTTELAPFYF